MLEKLQKRETDR